MSTVITSEGPHTSVAETETRQQPFHPLLGWLISLQAENPGRTQFIFNKPGVDQLCFDIRFEAGTIAGETRASLTITQPRIPLIERYGFCSGPRMIKPLVRKAWSVAYPAAAGLPGDPPELLVIKDGCWHNLVPGYELWGRLAVYADWIAQYAICSTSN